MSDRHIDLGPRLPVPSPSPFKVPMLPKPRPTPLKPLIPSPYLPTTQAISRSLSLLRENLKVIDDEDLGCPIPIVEKLIQTTQSLKADQLDFMADRINRFEVYSKLEALLKINAELDEARFARKHHQFKLDYSIDLAPVLHKHRVKKEESLHLPG